jgi:uncharacterized protein YeeX (DUF496 family)
VIEALNSYSVDKVEELVEKNRSNGSDRSSQIVVGSNLISYIFPPFSKEEIVTVISKLKGKGVAEFDEIPAFLVKECIP